MPARVLVPDVGTTSHAAAHAPACVSHEQGKRGHIGDATQNGERVRCISLCRYRLCAVRQYQRKRQHENLMLRGIDTAAHPRHNGQYHLSHKGAEQAHKGNAGQDGKHARRLLTRSLGEPTHDAAMPPTLLWHIAFKQLCKHTADHSDDVTSASSCTACPFP